MADKLTGVSTAKPEQGSLELTEELIRERAYHFYEKRGREDGHDVDDWLQAEAEVFGKKAASPAEPAAKEGKRRAATA